MNLDDAETDSDADESDHCGLSARLSNSCSSDRDSESEIGNSSGDSSSVGSQVPSINSDATSFNSAASSESEFSDGENTQVTRQKLFDGNNKTVDEAVLAPMDKFIKKRWKITTLEEVLGFVGSFSQAICLRHCANGLNL